MRTVRSILLTLVCALAILAVGYAGIIIGGEQVLKSPSEPEPVTMNVNISNLFYSSIEDDIQLYPWNYYPGEEEPPITVDRLETADIWGGMLFSDDGINLEYEVFYQLIALMADVDIEEVYKWYDNQERCIRESMKLGWDTVGSIYFFYDDVIKLYQKEYEVKIACNDWELISFSCIPVREEGIRDTEEWTVNREYFLDWMEKYLYAMQAVYANLEVIWNESYDETSWYRYVDMYMWYNEVSMAIAQEAGEDIDLSVLEEEAAAIIEAYGLGYMDKQEEMRKKIQEEIGVVDENENLAVTTEPTPIQVIELKSSLLLLQEKENSITMGLYYDVIDQRVTGFHYFPY